MITKVTITGADDSVSPMDLYHLQNEFPFAEFGILLSRKQYGNNRFPSREWIVELITDKHLGINLSGHLCGAYVREFLKGDTKFFGELPVDPFVFDRFQINTHAEPHEFNTLELTRWLTGSPTGTYIFQWDGVNDENISKLLFNTRTQILFDLSHGAGLLPKEWPNPMINIPCGYAGGLSPDNLKEQIERIEALVGEKEIWIDMETHVRSNNDQQFDLTKVRKCLEIAANFMNL